MLASLGFLNDGEERKWNTLYTRKRDVSNLGLRYTCG